MNWHEVLDVSETAGALFSKRSSEERHACYGSGEVKGLHLTWKEKGMRMVLKPISLMRQATESKFCVMALGPCQRPSSIVEAVSNPNLQGKSPM